MANQAPLTLTSTNGVSGTPLPLTFSGGSGTGAVSYAVTDGTAAGCLIALDGTLNATSAGTCIVTATKAGDANYNAVSSAPTTVTFALHLLLPRLRRPRQRRLPSLRPRQPRPITATGWSALTAASSPSAQRSSMARRATCTCSVPWSALHRQQATWATGSSLVTAGSSASVTPGSTVQSPDWVSRLPGPACPTALNAPIVGMVPSSDGNGYFMVGADGGVFTFGDAKFEGSCPAIGGCAGGAAVAVMPDATGNGYWVVTAGGDVQPFGDAAAYGGPGPVGGPVVAAVRTPDGGGYYVLFGGGEVFAYGDAVYRGGAYGEVGGSNPASTIFTTADNGGYWIVSANGSVITEGDAPYEGGANELHLNGAIIAGTGW